MISLVNLAFSLALENGTVTAKQRQDATVLKVQTTKGTREFSVPEVSIDRSELIVECAGSLVFKVHNYMDHLYKFSTDGMPLYSLHGQFILASKSASSIFVEPRVLGEQEVAEVHIYSFDELCRHDAKSFNVVTPTYAVGKSSTMMGGSVLFSSQSHVISQSKEFEGLYVSVLLPALSNRRSKKMTVVVLTCNSRRCSQTMSVDLKGQSFEAKNLTLVGDGMVRFDLIDYSVKPTVTQRIEVKLDKSVTISKSR
jgi:hypothetical protein